MEESLVADEAEEGGGCEKEAAPEWGRKKNSP